MINGKVRPQVADAFVKLTRDAVERMAAARFSLAAFRLVLFLVREHLRHGGKENGRLKGPHRQLVAFGISAGLVASAIRETERAGLVRGHRVGRRRATLFELTWLPCFGRPAHLPPDPEAGSKNLPPKPEARLPPDQEAER